jgi:hypothetical protein
MGIFVLVLLMMAKNFLKSNQIIPKDYRQIPPKKGVSIKARSYTLYRIYCRDRPAGHLKRTCIHFGLPKQVFDPKTAVIDPDCSEIQV